MSDHDDDAEYILEILTESGVSAIPPPCDRCGKPATCQGQEAHRVDVTKFRDPYPMRYGCDAHRGWWLK